MPARAPEPGRDVCQQGSLPHRHREVSEPTGKGSRTPGKGVSQRAERWLGWSWIASEAGRSCHSDGSSHPNYTSTDSFLKSWHMSDFENPLSLCALLSPRCAVSAEIWWFSQGIERWGGNLHQVLLCF